MTAVAARPVQFPATWHDRRRELLRPTNTPLWLDRGGWVNGKPVGGTRYRRAITRLSPFLFAITYLGKDLRDPETGEMSFCDFHMDAYVRARQWVRREAQRDVVVVHRDAGKSTMYFRVLPLFGLAHGHQPFFCAFSYTGDQAKGHLANILDILHGRSEVSELLLHDFPELRPVRGAGGPRITVLQGGEDGRRAIGAYGMHESSLGLNVDGKRPTLMVGDDIEPGGDKWSPKTRKATLAALMENILPMNRRAVVQVVGTVTARGSVIHDAVQVAQGRSSRSWVQDARFRVHYYPAIVDEGLPTERSSWPQRFPLAELQADRYNQDGTLNRPFALTMMNDPVREEAGAYWQSGFKYLPRSRVDRWVCWVDPAKSTHETSDYTAYVVAGLLWPPSPGRRPSVVVAVAEQGHWSPRETAQRLDVLRGRFAGLQVFVEYNALGSEEAARDQYRLRRGDRGMWSKAPKEVRIRAAADVYADELVVHAKPLQPLQDILTGYGSGGNDDLPDSLAGALGVLLPGKIPA